MPRLRNKSNPWKGKQKEKETVLVPDSDDQKEEEQDDNTEPSGITLLTIHMVSVFLCLNLHPSHYFLLPFAFYIAIL